ncbi:MAG: hypothetical protein R6U44_01045 [Archaeoglobaceae archaeon]
MELWKRLAKIYISENDNEEIIAELDSLYKEVSQSEFDIDKKKRLENTIKKIKKSDNVSKSLEHYFSKEHAHFLLNREEH